MATHQAAILGKLEEHQWYVHLSRVKGADLGVIKTALRALREDAAIRNVNLGLFFQVTAVFLLIFVVQLFIFGFHELTEANLLPNSALLNEATEPYGPDGIYGHYLTYLLVLLPIGWLAFSSLFSGRKRMSPAS